MQVNDMPKQNNADESVPSVRGDIFNRMMRLPVLNRMEPFYRKHKEILLYLFFGGVTFAVSIATYAFFISVLGADALVANIFSWIFAVSVAYITNRLWVYESNAIGWRAVLKEMGKFFSGRIATLLVEEMRLLVLIKWLHFDNMAVKVVAQIVVILLNYVISKLWVF